MSAVRNQRTLALAGGYRRELGHDLVGHLAVHRRPPSSATTPTPANDRIDLRKSRLIVMWGTEPRLERRATPAYNYHAGQEGRRKVYLHRSRTTAIRRSVLADEWIPIRPGTDTTMLLAIGQC